MPGIMSQLSAALADRYTIVSKLGEGGMASVYLAEDIKHSRQVALKVLKPELAAVVGAERFLAEIQTTANLQHPHILPLFDSGEADGFLFYVMPYVEGETLADRIAREAQLPVDEALGIATSVAAALQVAHDAGIVHRDIKPGNILLSRGEPLVADFGIALAVGAGGSRLTETGLSVGTPYYMSPEQATGDQSIGPAADIYALACVLFEMLVGEPPYLGNTAQAVLGKIIQGLPVSAMTARKSVPANADAALRKALEKLPADRFTSASGFAKALADPAFRHGESAQTAWAPGSTRWRTAALSASAVAVVAVAAGITGAFGFQSAPESVLRQRIELSHMGDQVPWGRFLALAPDGSGMVYMDRVDENESAQLFYKHRDEVEGTPLPGTEDVNGVVFSPDGLWIAFTQRGSLVKRPVRGGAAITLAQGVDQGVPGLDWMDDGTILYEIDAGDQLARIADDGSSPPDTVLALGSMRWAHGIDGHETALVLRCGSCDLGIVDLETGDVTFVLEDIARAWYVRSGHIVYVTNAGAVFAAPFDPESRELGAIGTPLFEGVRTGTGFADMVIGDDGTMVYVSGSGVATGDTESLVWVQRDGTFELVDPNWPVMNLDIPALSPDGSRVALSIQAGGNVDVWVHELPDGPRTRLTPGDGDYFDPVWTPDGQSVVFWSDEEGELLRMRADGSAASGDVLLRADDPILGPRLTPSGDGVVFASTGGASIDVVYLDASADSTVALLTRDFMETAPTVSPDGRWLAYASNVTGDLEVFVRPFPDVGRSRTQVSNGGGMEPVWARGGNEIFYRSGEGYLVSATFRADSVFTVEARTDLFEMGRDYISRSRRRSYDVDATGERFLMVRNAETMESEEGAEADIILVQNWFVELRERLGGGN